jgi:hypothetical protein
MSQSPHSEGNAARLGFKISVCCEDAFKEVWLRLFVSPAFAIC